MQRLHRATCWLVIALTLPLLIVGCDAFSDSSSTGDAGVEKRTAGADGGVDVGMPSAIAREQSVFDATTDCETFDREAETYLICVPEPWNGGVVLYARGTQPANASEPTVADESFEIAELVGPAGFAVAATSFSTTGLSALVGPAELAALARSVSDYLPADPTTVFFAGASQGSLISTLLTEQNPDLVDGTMAVCGPTGSFIRQANYSLDVRILFDVYFPGLIDGEATDVPPDVIAAWQSGDLKQDVREAVAARPDRARSVLRGARYPGELDRPSLLPEMMVAALTDGIENTNDVIDKLGGVVADNTDRFYFGANNDLLVNLLAERVDANEDALDLAQEELETSGDLEVPYVSLHTLNDTRVLVTQQLWYRLKAIRNGSGREHAALPIPRFGHCEFDEGELLAAFVFLVYRATGRLPLPAPDQILATAGEREQYRTWAVKHDLPLRAQPGGEDSFD